MKRVFLLFLDIIFSFFYRIIPLNEKVIVFNSTANKKYCHNSVFLFEAMLVDARYQDKKIYFVINDSKLRGELNYRFPGHFVSSRTISGKLLCLNAKTWITSTIETPVFGVSVNKNRIVYHLGHGVPLKNIGLAEENISALKIINRKFRLRLFTHVTCYSDFFEGFFKKVFSNDSLSYLKLGQPRNDTLRNSLCIENTVLAHSFLNKAKKVILYSPTWRPYANTKFFPFDSFSVQDLHDFLEKNEYFLCLREHPNYKADIPEGVYDSDWVFDLNGDVIKDINPYLNYFDVLITDYSSIYFDFIILDKPVIYVPYDFELYKSSVGFSKPYDELISGVVVNSFDDFMLAIDDSESIGRKNHSSLIENLNLKADGNIEEHLEVINELLTLS